MKKSTIFLLSCLSFIFGLAIHSFFSLPFFYVYIILLVCFILLVLNWSKKWLKITILFCLLLIAGFWRYQLSIKNLTSDQIQYYNNQNITFIGVVAQEPDARIDNIKYTINSDQLKINGQSRTVSGKVLVTANLYPEYNYGDKLQITCTIKTPEPFSGFDYDRYLSRYDIYSLCYYPEIVKLDSGQGSIILAKIFKFKNYLENLINQSLPEPQASLFSAIILGVRRGIPQDLLDQLAITGIMHLIAISGLHITTIIAVLMAVAPFFYLSRKVAFYLISIFLVLYVIMIGFPASAVRAAVMGFLVLFAMYLGRLNKSLNALVFVAATMLLINPKLLRDDVGFQLSFAAVLGIIYFSSLFERLFERVSEKLYLLTAALQMTLSAQIMTLPLILYHFGRLSLVAIPTNLLVVPALPYFMPASFLTLILGSIFQKISWIIFIPIWLFLTYLIKLVNILSALPLAAININHFPVWAVIFSYLLILSFLIWYNKISQISKP